MGDDTCPTDIAMELAGMERDAEFIRAEIEDDKINDAVLGYDCDSVGSTIDELDAKATPEEEKELEDTIAQIPIDPNDEYEQVMELVKTDKPKVSIDELMGIGDDAEDEEIVRELANVANED